MAEGKYVRLTVEDTGHGIPPETLNRIFDPYFTTKKPGEGTGLGLSVVHGIVKSHGGTVTVSGEPGKGAVFSAFFPVIEEDVIMEDEPRTDYAPGGNERILFLDDEDMLVDMGKEMLERLGYEVVPKTSSVEALELFRSDPFRFDLVITDRIMPKMTGDELAGELSAIRPEIPIVVCTGFGQELTQEDAKALGIGALLMKPISRKDIALTIRRLLDQAREMKNG
jgi:CheY-like chemotaxis protein